MATRRSKQRSRIRREPRDLIRVIDERGTVMVVPHFRRGDGNYVTRSSSLNAEERAIFVETLPCNGGSEQKEEETR